MIKEVPEVLVYNFTKERIPQAFLKENTRKILKYLANPKKAISLLIVPSSIIQKLNYNWRKKKRATTVLTFAEGDIFLCPEEIKKQALLRKISLKKMYQLLLIHSILHLLGYTHDGVQDSKEMEKLEKAIFLKLTTINKKK